MTVAAITRARWALRLAPICGVFAAIVWLVGTPMFMMAGVLGPSDPQAEVFGGLAAGLGLTLLPIMVLVGSAPLKFRRALQVGGTGITAAMIVLGGMLVAGATGNIRSIAGPWMPNAAFVAVLLFFVWMLPTSWAAHGPSTVQRWIFWVGLFTAGSLLLQVLAWTVVYFANRDFVMTNTGLGGVILPVEFFVDFGLWVLFPSWVIALGIRVAWREGG